MKASRCLAIIMEYALKNFSLFRILDSATFQSPCSHTGQYNSVSVESSTEINHWIGSIVMISRTTPPLTVHFSRNYRYLPKPPEHNIHSPPLISHNAIFQSCIVVCNGYSDEQCRFIHIYFYPNQNVPEKAYPRNSIPTDIFPLLSSFSISFISFLMKVQYNLYNFTMRYFLHIAHYETLTIKLFDGNIEISLFCD